MFGRVTDELGGSAPYMYMYIGLSQMRASDLTTFAKNLSSLPIEPPIYYYKSQTIAILKVSEMIFV